MLLLLLLVMMLQHSSRSSSGRRRRVEKSRRHQRSTVVSHSGCSNATGSQSGSISVGCDRVARTGRLKSGRPTAVVTGAIHMRVILMGLLMVIPVCYGGRMRLLLLLLIDLLLLLRRRRDDGESSRGRSR